MIWILNALFTVLCVCRSPADALYQTILLQETQIKVTALNPADGNIILWKKLVRVSIFLFLKIEMVSAISGLILGFCTLKGYELLGGKLSKLGIVISLAIMLITPYLAYNTYLATEIMDMFGLGFGDAYEAVDMLKDVDGYTEDLVQIYIFTIIGGAACVWNTIKNKK